MNERGKQSYELRVQTRRSWSVIAEELGYGSHKGASVAARRYAEYEGLPWPIESVSKGSAIYRSRRLGLSWHKLAQRYGQTIRSVQRCAYKHARRHGWEWPP
jgi:hypothetical protein